MNIDWVIPCRYVEVHDNLGTLVGAGIDTFWLKELPAPIQVLLGVRLLAMAEELDGEPHEAINRVRTPAGEVLSEVRSEFGIKSENAQQDWLSGVMLATVVQFQAEHAGTYMIEFVIDGNSKELPLHVVLGPPPGHEE